MHCFFSFCRSSILNDHSGVVANCDYTSEWVHWVRACIGIAMGWVMLRKSLLTFLLPARKMQFSFLLNIQDCKEMSNARKIAPRVPSTCAQNAILSLLIIHIIPRRQIYVAIENPLFVPSVSCLTTSRYLWNHVYAADNISHADNLQSNGCRCFSHLYKFRDGIQVTRVFRYCGERQG